jgi:hypothetical protein
MIHSGSVDTVLLSFAHTLPIARQARLPLL